jgi:hypothetical protein
LECSSGDEIGESSTDHLASLKFPSPAMLRRLVFLKLFERVYAPLTAGMLSPVSGDTKLQHQKRCQLDRLYQRVIDDLDKLMDAVGLKAA